MSENPARKDPAAGTAPLESRIAALEESLARVNIFNQKVTEALTHALERLKAFEEMGATVAQLDRKFENSRVANALARASKIFPKTRTVVFVSKGFFGDNVKYTYLAFCEYVRGKNVDVRFLTDDPRQHALLTAAGLPVLPCDPDHWKVEDARALLGARVAVLNDNFHPYSMRSPKAYGMLQGARTVQLWHGIPIKEVGMRYVLRGDNVILDELLASSGEFDVFVAPGKAAREDWAQRFAFREMAALGYARNDVFFREPSERDLLNVDRETLAFFQDAHRAGKPSIIYTPTYRDDEASSWFDKAGLGTFADHARAQGYAFAVNLHPYEQVLLDNYRARYPSIRFVAPGTDIYPIVKYADIMMTDYSSLMFDYLLLDRPVVFYRPDKCVVEARGWIEGRTKDTPGAVVTDVVDLIRAADAAAGYVRNPAGDPHRAARHALRDRLFDHVDGNAAERICKLIMDMVEAPLPAKN